MFQIDPVNRRKRLHLQSPFDKLINTTHDRNNKPKEDYLSYETKWKKTEIKSFRLSPSLLEMVQSECQSRRTHFSDFVRYAVIVAMKRGRGRAAAFYP
jgi:hypothetical protein